MTEGEQVVLGAEHAERDAFVRGSDGIADERGEQPRLDLGADERGRLQRGPAGRRQARPTGEHRVPHGDRDAGLAAGQGLGDEARVAAGLAVERGGIEPLAGGERLHRLDRQRRQRDSAHCGRRGQVAEDDSQRVARAELVVAIGQHEERGHLPDAPAEELDQVERCRVRPVQVLEDGDHGRAVPELIEDCREDHPGRRVCFEPLSQSRAGLLGDVIHGSQRPRGCAGNRNRPCPVRS
jgi:hypothetical protein